MFRATSVMSSDLAALVWIMGVVLVLACTIVAIRHVSGQYQTVRLRRSLAATVIPDNAALCVKPVLTDAETRLLRSLEKAVDGTYLVWPQLPLWTFIDVRSSDAGVVAVLNNRINLKRVDFTLVDPHTHSIYKVIELDDRSHQRPDRLHRDTFVEMVLKQAGVPLIRIPAAKAYDTQAIRAQLGLSESAATRSKLA